MLLKREDLQPVRSYKLRGAFNFLVQADAESLGSGVVCASAGNHAQGVALACAQLGVKGRVYLPRTTPRQKREWIAWLGGAAVEIQLVGDTYDEAIAACNAHSAETGALVVPAFDAETTIAGQGTVAREVVGQLGSRPDLFVVPVGGGGLLAGCVTWLGDGARVVGFEPAGAPSMTAALAAGQPVRLDELDSFVDGAALRQVGALTHSIIAAAGTPVRTVSEGALCSELLALYQFEGIIAEPAGALATAALAEIDIAAGSTVVCVISGGNNDVSRYGEILERAAVVQADDAAAGVDADGGATQAHADAELVVLNGRVHQQFVLAALSGQERLAQRRSLVRQLRLRADNVDRAVEAELAQRRRCGRAGKARTDDDDAAGHDVSSMPSAPSVTFHVRSGCFGGPEMTAPVVTSNVLSLYRQHLHSSRWLRLAAAGAQPQRPLWASVAPKDDRYSDVHYVERLVARARS